MLRLVLKLARITIGNPGDGLKAVLDIPVDRAQVAMLALLAAILSVLLGGIESVMLRGPSSGLFAPNLASPFAAAGIQVAVIIIMALIVHYAGQMFGGHGRLDQAYVTVIWLQAMNFLVQGAGFFLMLVFAIPFALVLVVSVVISIWLLVNFVAVLHGFSSLGKVFGGVLGLYVAVSVVIGIILDLLGLAPGGA